MIYINDKTLMLLILLHLWFVVHQIKWKSLISVFFFNCRIMLANVCFLILKSLFYSIIIIKTF